MDDINKKIEDLQWETIARQEREFWKNKFTTRHPAGALKKKQIDNHGSN